MPKANKTHKPLSTTWVGGGGGVGGGAYSPPLDISILYMYALWGVDSSALTARAHSKNTQRHRETPFSTILEHSTQHTPHALEHARPANSLKHAHRVVRVACANVMLFQHNEDEQTQARAARGSRLYYYRVLGESTYTTTPPPLKLVRAQSRRPFLCMLLCE